MPTKTFSYQPIRQGYPWSLALRVVSPTPLFPVGAALRAQVRASIGNPRVLGALTTEAGTIERIDDNAVKLTIPGRASRDWPEGFVFLDLARTDGTDRHLGITLRIQVKTPITAAT